MTAMQIPWRLRSSFLEVVFVRIVCFFCRCSWYFVTKTGPRQQRIHEVISYIKTHKNSILQIHTYEHLIMNMEWQTVVLTMWEKTSNGWKHGTRTRNLNFSAMLKLEVAVYCRGSELMNISMVLQRKSSVKSFTLIFQWLWNKFLRKILKRVSTNFEFFMKRDWKFSRQQKHLITKVFSSQHQRSRPTRKWTNRQVQC